MYGPDVAILLKYESYDMRHKGFSQVYFGQWDPRELGHHNKRKRIPSRNKRKRMLTLIPRKSFFPSGH